jgi:signal transduction histidine kinase
VEIVRPLLDAHGHELTVLVPSPPVRIIADLARFIQVLTNLLNNAAKFTPDGGQLTVTATLTDGEVVVQVTDNGMGMHEALVPHVFDLFTQADVGLDRGQGGLGVGLTLVKRLVEMHGGTVAAESAGVGQGSTFTVRLPASSPTALELEKVPITF